MSASGPERRAAGAPDLPPAALAALGVALVAVLVALGLTYGFFGLGTKNGGTGADDLHPAADPGVWTEVIAPDTPFRFPHQVPAADGRTQVLPRADELAGACHVCHGEIAAEWSRSQHALAWVDEHFQASLAERRRPEACYGCHAPEPLHGAGRRFGSAPYVRDAAVEDWHFGVSCATCHLGPDGSTWLGPSADAAAPHPVAQGESFVGVASNRLCIDCHRTDVGPVLGIAKEYERSDLAARGIGCVQCHFAPTERPSAAGAAVRSGRSHELLGPRHGHFLAQAFALEATRREGGTIGLAVTNRAGHRVPGLVGRELRFVARLLDTTGAETARTAFQFDAENTLALGETRAFELAGSGALVHIVGEHAAPGLAQPVRFLELRIEVAAGVRR